MNEAEIEQEIQEKQLNAPRLTPMSIDDAIVSVQYYVFPGTVCTVCCLTLKNGFAVVGESAPISPNNFDEDLGKKIAFDNAREKVWMLEGYLAKQRLFDAK